MKNVKANHNGNPSTPARNNNATRSCSFLSPGGFQLQNFIDTFGDSPFQAKAATTPSSSSTTKTPSTNTGTPRRDVEWHECIIKQSHVGLLDWTLKSALDFQCQPALDLLDASGIQSGGAAMQRFITDTTCTTKTMYNGTVNYATAMIDWQAALLHWQHPATYPLPSQLFQGQQGIAAAAAASTVKLEKEENGRGLDGTKPSGSNTGTGGSHLFASVGHRCTADQKSFHGDVRATIGFINQQ